jgi:hypothetical protein
MSIGTIVYPAIPKVAEKEVADPQASRFDGRDIAIVCLSGALVLVVVALVILLATRYQLAVPTR